MSQDQARLGQTKHSFIVEHLDPELEEWQQLEYSTISRECQAADSTFILSGRPEELAADPSLSAIITTSKTVEQLLQEASIPKSQACLLDPKGEKDLSPEDGDQFSVFIFGGILGDEPPRDRTAELRAKGTGHSHGGVRQDTARQGALYRPTDLEVAPGESVSMPFKYVADKEGKPILPQGMMQLLAQDADKDILDLL